VPPLNHYRWLLLIPLLKTAGCKILLEIRAGVF